MAVESSCRTRSNRPTTPRRFATAKCIAVRRSHSGLQGDAALSVPGAARAAKGNRVRADVARLRAGHGRSSICRAEHGDARGLLRSDARLPSPHADDEVPAQPVSQGARNAACRRVGRGIGPARRTALSRAGVGRDGRSRAHRSRRGHAQRDQCSELLNEMAKKNVMVEICLTSNDVILGVRGRQSSAARFHAGRRAGCAGHRRRRRVAFRHDARISAGRRRPELVVQRLEAHGANQPGTRVHQGPQPVEQRQDVCSGEGVCGRYKRERITQATCQKFLDGSDKARLQWKLEQQFREFEGREWPAATVESSRAAAR